MAWQRLRARWRSRRRPSRTAAEAARTTRCPTGTRTTGTRPDSFGGGGGSHLSISLTKGTAATSTFSGSVETDIGFIIAEAKATFGYSYAKSVSYSVTYGTTWTVPTSWSVGYLHIGAQASSMDWEVYRYDYPCTVHVLRHGHAQLPWQAHYTWHNHVSVGGVNTNS